MGFTLITWSSGHFALQTTPRLRSERAVLSAVAEDFWFLSESAEDDLTKHATEKHIACEENCPKCQEHVSVSFWKVRAQEDLLTLRDLSDGCKHCYLDIGARYHALDFSQKARFGSDERCKAAHEQFWFSRTARREDGFFEPLFRIEELCDQAERVLENAETIADVKKAFVYLNKVRAEVGRIVAPLNDLSFGIELMSKTKNKKAEWKFDGDLRSREAMISEQKVASWKERMGDWERDAEKPLR